MFLFHTIWCARNSGAIVPTYSLSVHSAHPRSYRTRPKPQAFRNTSDRAKPYNRPYVRSVDCGVPQLGPNGLKYKSIMPTPHVGRAARPRPAIPHIMRSSARIFVRDWRARLPCARKKDYASTGAKRRACSKLSANSPAGTRSAGGAG